MKPDQIEKRIGWLDEQHRKGADLVSLLETRLGEAIETLDKQEKQIKDLSSEVTRLSAVATRIQHYDDALAKQRSDFSKKLADTDQLYSEKQRHLEDIRKKDYEELSTSISIMREKQKDLELIRDAIEARKQEETRISREIAELEERIETSSIKMDEHSRDIHSVEEAKKIDTRKITDLQSESTELRQKLDAIRGKQDSFEDRMRRAESTIDEIVMREASHKEVYTLWEEKQELRMVEFEKNWKAWQGMLEGFQSKAIELDEKVLKFDENYRALNKARSELDKLLERLERRITEVSEMQRIGEERLKQEWTSFQADQHKSWNTYKLTNDEMWRDHTRIHDRITEDVQSINEKLSESLEVINELAEKSQSRIIDLLNTIRVWADEIEKRVGEIR